MPITPANAAGAGIGSFRSAKITPQAIPAIKALINSIINCIIDIYYLFASFYGLVILMALP